MKVIVGNKVFDGNDVPVMVDLSDEDKANIGNMHADKRLYVAFPESFPRGDVEAWANAYKNGLLE